MSALLKKFAVLSLGFMMGCSVFAGAKSYKIALDRQIEKGYRYNVLCKGKSTDNVAVSMNGQTVKQEEKIVDFDFDIDCKVIDIDKDKKLATKLLLTINKLVAIKEGDKKVLLEKGTEVTVYSKDKNNFYESKGKAVSKNIKDIFSASGAFDIFNGGATSDEIMGSEKKRKAGDSWKINSKLALSELQQKDGLSKLSKDDISGRMTLLEETKSGNVPCLKIGCQLEVKNLTPPLPPFLKTKKAEMKMKAEGFFPVDITKQLLKDIKEMEMNLVASGRQNPQAPLMTIQMTRKSKAASTYKPL